MPVFARARAQAQTTTCLSNMKQLGYGFLMYLGDSDQRYCYTGEGFNYLHSPNWVISGTTQFNHGSNPICPGATSGTWDCCSIADPEDGCIYPYVKSQQVYKCPTVESKFNRQCGRVVTTATMRTTYSMNDQFVKTHVVNNFEYAEKVGQLTYPAATILLVDESARTLNDGNYNAPALYDALAERHADAANMALADGHAKRFGANQVEIRVDDNTTTAGPFFSWFYPERKDQ